MTGLDPASRPQPLAPPPWCAGFQSLRRPSPDHRSRCDRQSCGSPRRRRRLATRRAARTTCSMRSATSWATRADWRALRGSSPPPARTSATQTGASTLGKCARFCCKAVCALARRGGAARCRRARQRRRARRVNAARLLRSPHVDDTLQPSNSLLLVPEQPWLPAARAPSSARSVSPLALSIGDGEGELRTLQAPDADPYLSLHMETLEPALATAILDDPVPADLPQAVGEQLVVRTFHWKLSLLGADPKNSPSKTFSSMRCHHRTWRASRWRSALRRWRYAT